SWARCSLRRPTGSAHPGTSTRWSGSGCRPTRGRPTRPASTPTARHSPAPSAPTLGELTLGELTPDEVAGLRAQPRVLTEWSDCTGDKLPFASPKGPSAEAPKSNEHWMADQGARSGQGAFR